MMVTGECIVIIDFAASYDSGVNLLVVRINYSGDSGDRDGSGYRTKEMVEVEIIIMMEEVNVVAVHSIS